MRNRFQNTYADEDRLVVERLGLPDEVHTCSSAEEAEARVRVLDCGMTWLGTPFVDCAGVKGPNGAVDCVHFCRGAYVEAGWVEWFPIEPYSPQWLMHQNEQKILEFIERLGVTPRETADVVPGDLSVFHWGRVFAHVAICMNRDLVLHAYKVEGRVTVSDRNETSMRLIGLRSRFAGAVIERPVRNYSVWRS